MRGSARGYAVSNLHLMIAAEVCAVLLFVVAGIVIFFPLIIVDAPQHEVVGERAVYNETMNWTTCYITVKSYKQGMYFVEVQADGQTGYAYKLMWKNHTSTLFVRFPDLEVDEFTYRLLGPTAKEQRSWFEVVTGG